MVSVLESAEAEVVGQHPWHTCWRFYATCYNEAAAAEPKFAEDAESAACQRRTSAK